MIKKRIKKFIKKTFSIQIAIFSFLIIALIVRAGDITIGSSVVNFSNKLIIDSLGNVGIGTNNPNAMLDISKIGDGEKILRLGIERQWCFMQKGSGSSTALQLSSDCGGTNTNKNFIINTSGSLIVNSRIGIGTLTPGYPLEIKKSTNNAHITLKGDYSPTGSTSKGTFMAFRDNSALRVQMGLYDNSAYSGGSGTDFFIASLGKINLNAGSASVGGGIDATIDTNGNVGIGTTSPEAKLDVEGEILVDMMRYTGVNYDASLDTTLAAMYCASLNPPNDYTQVIKQTTAETCSATCARDASYTSCLGGFFWHPRGNDARVYSASCAYASYQKYCCCE